MTLIKRIFNPQDQIWEFAHHDKYGAKGFKTPDTQVPIGFYSIYLVFNILCKISGVMGPVFYLLHLQFLTEVLRESFGIPRVLQGEFPKNSRRTSEEFPKNLRRTSEEIRT